MAALADAVGVHVESRVADAGARRQEGVGSARAALVRSGAAAGQTVTAAQLANSVGVHEVAIVANTVTVDSSEGIGSAGQTTGRSVVGASVTSVVAVQLVAVAVCIHGVSTRTSTSTVGLENRVGLAGCALVVADGVAVGAGVGASDTVSVSVHVVSAQADTSVT